MAHQMRFEQPGRRHSARRGRCDRSGPAEEGRCGHGNPVQGGRRDLHGPGWREHSGRRTRSDPGEDTPLQPGETDAAERLYRYEDLATRFCGLPLENPFLLAASPSTDSLEMVGRGLEMGWAGAILKTTTVPGARVDLANPMMTGLDRPSERLVGMGNIDLISVHPAAEVARRVRILKRGFPHKMIAASIMGSRREEWQDLVRRMEDAGADLIECSFSCPQGSMGENPGRMLAQSAGASERVAGWVVAAARAVPVAIKITPQVTDIVEIARAVERAGVQAITASNSVPGLMGIDIESHVPYPSLDGRSTYSGLTGPAIKPITLRTIAEIARHVRLPILGTGGASTWRDAVEFMLAGAGAVQFCTAVMHHGFRIIDDLMTGMALYLERKQLTDPGRLVGKALPHIVGHDDLPRLTVRSRVVEEACIGCGLCYVACRDGGHEAISWSEARVPRIDSERCTGCGLCMTVKPVEDCLGLEVVEP
ncbi:MAG: NAD-dependent dihydropyrimidine dehydrogenase subunit PreA [Candidatus Eisenbacteria bacterium]|nr:NAD-dependent dihydropyrimidine dehydrogenase subunit PreA [Candidatus Eisenbacteria bacterium]